VIAAELAAMALTIELPNTPLAVLRGYLDTAAAPLPFALSATPS